MKEITNNNFKSDVLTANSVVLLDVWAPWCAPCRGMAPIVEQLDEESGDEVTVAKLNAEAEPEVVAQLGVTGLPTFLVFKNGKVVSSHVGSITKDALKKMIAEAESN